MPVQRRELGPLGHHHAGVSPAEGLERIRGELDPDQQRPGHILGHRIVGADLGPIGLEPGRQDERGCLTHVVRLGLEGQPEQRNLAAHKRPQVLLKLGDHATLLELVDLDHCGQELEVIARVAGELLQG